MEPQPPPKPVNLAKLATIFACTFCIAFGLCSVSLFTNGMGFRNATDLFVRASLLTEAVCLLGLLVVGVMAIFRD